MQTPNQPTDSNISQCSPAWIYIRLTRRFPGCQASALRRVPLPLGFRSCVAYQCGCVLFEGTLPVGLQQDHPFWRAQTEKKSMRRASSSGPRVWDPRSRSRRPCQGWARGLKPAMRHHSKTGGQTQFSFLRHPFWVGLKGNRRETIYFSWALKNSHTHEYCSIYRQADPGAMEDGPLLPAKGKSGFQETEHHMDSSRATASRFMPTALPRRQSPPLAAGVVSVPPASAAPGVSAHRAAPKTMEWNIDSYEPKETKPIFEPCGLPIFWIGSTMRKRTCTLRCDNNVCPRMQAFFDRKTQHPSET